MDLLHVGIEGYLFCIELSLLVQLDGSALKSGFFLLGPNLPCNVAVVVMLISEGVSGNCSGISGLNSTGGGTLSKGEQERSTSKVKTTVWMNTVIKSDCLRFEEFKVY